MIFDLLKAKFYSLNMTYKARTQKNIKSRKITITSSRRLTISGALTMVLSISMKTRFDRLYVSSTLNRLSPIAFTTVLEIEIMIMNYCLIFLSS